MMLLKDIDLGQSFRLENREHCWHCGPLRFKTTFTMWLKIYNLVVAILKKTVMFISLGA